MRAAVTALVEAHPEIEEVHLFGSLARGDMTPRSDADLLVILREASDPPRDRIPRYLPDHTPVPVDVFPFTRAEIEARRREGDRFLTRVFTEAIRLYPPAEGERIADRAR